MGNRYKYRQGETLAGYPLEIVKKIGHGGMAAVYEAMDTELGILRAVKVLDVGVTGIGGKEPIDELRQEARVMARLHQHCKDYIVQVLYVGQTKDDRGSLFIVMERLTGCALKDLLPEGPVNWHTAKQIAQHVGEALAAAHEDGIVHRDIKPANIYCHAPPELRGTKFVLLDFGIASIVNWSTNRFKGTFKYAAPEQTHSPAVITSKTDIYSLGIVLYEILAGRHPFEDHKSNADLIRAHRAVVPPPLSVVAHGAPPELDALIASMIAKLPEDRPESMRAVIARIMTIHWNDQRELKPVAETDTTVQEVGTMVQNVEGERQPREVALPFAPTDPIDAPSDVPAKANGSTLKSRQPDARMSPEPRPAPVVVIEPSRAHGGGSDLDAVASELPVKTPKIRKPEPRPYDPARGANGFRSSPTRSAPLPDVTDPMYGAPALPPGYADARAAARRVDRQQEFGSPLNDSVALPLHSPKWVPVLFAMSIAFAVGVFALIIYVRSTSTKNALDAGASSAAATIAQAPIALTASAAAPVTSAEPIQIAPAAVTSTATPAATPPPTVPAVVATPAHTTEAAKTPRRAPAPSASQDPDVSLLFRDNRAPAAASASAQPHRMPGSGL